MLSNYIIATAMLANCACALETFDRHELFQEQRTFSGISSLQISSNSGTVRIQQSQDTQTVVSYDGHADIIQNGSQLVVENLQKGFFSFLSPSRCNFCINIPANVNSVDISIGDGEAIINSDNINRLNISGGNIKTHLKEMKGEIRLSAGNCDVNYYCSTLNRGQKVAFDVSSGKLNFNAFLAQSFTGFCSLLRGAAIKISEVFLPMKSNDQADISINGRCASANISVKELME